MKEFVLLVLLMISLTSCKTLTLPETATFTEKYEASCEDISTAISKAEKILLTILTDEQRSYWQRYLEGAKVAHYVLCSCGEEE